MPARLCQTLILLLLTTSTCLADQFLVELHGEKAPADELSEEIAAQLSDTGLAIKKSETSTLGYVWFCKSWEVAPDFKQTVQLLYPFKPGQLIGVIQLRRKHADFRDQDIGRGVYTLRYGQQPIDGNHVGTSPTRDFLLLLPAEKDRDPKPLGYEELAELSKEAAESSHPAMLALQSVQTEAAKEAKIHLDEDREWQLLLTAGNAKAGDKDFALPIDIVIDGHADE